MKKLFTFTGPSCSGKTTLIRKLLDTGEFCEVVSFTTRQPRHGEVQGVDYNFVSVEQAEAWIKADETAENIKFKDNYYGITKAEIESKMDSGKTPLVIVEPKGLQQLRESFDLFSVYVDCPLEVLYTRFLTRFRENTNANIEYEARRVATIYLEKTNWPEDVGDMDMWVGTFSPETENTVMALIMKAAQKNG